MRRFIQTFTLLTYIMWGLAGMCAAALGPTDKGDPVEMAPQRTYMDPELDRAPEGFEYFSRPITCLGIPVDHGELHWTEVTPEGFLANGETEFVPLAGRDLRPVNARVRGLYQGWMPCVEYTVRDGDIEYRWRMFGAAAQVAGGPLRYDMIQVTARNVGVTPQTATFGAGIRHGGSIKEVPRLKLKNPHIYDDRELWRIEDSHVSRGDKALFFFAGQPQRKRVATDEEYSVPYTGREKAILRDTISGIVVWEKELAPGAECSEAFVYPYHSVSVDDPESLAAVAGLEWAGEFEAFENRWNSLFKGAGTVHIPEEKIQNLVRASLAKMIIARTAEVAPDDQSPLEVQKVNAFTYEFFPANDSPYFDAAYLHWGLFDKARENQIARRHLLTQNGAFVAGGVWEAYGEALWITHRYYQVTGDRETAEQLYACVKKTVDHITGLTATDPMGLLPMHEHDDGEVGKGHFIGHNLWWLAGLRNAAELAEELGHRDDMQKFGTLYVQFEDKLGTVLGQIGDRFGYLAARAEGEGQLWGVLTCAWPARPLPPDHPLVGPTLSKAMERSAEGIIMYKEQIHDYVGLDVVGARILRGEAEQALRYLYDTAVHTTSTHDGFECDLIPWTNRDPWLNLTPHTWFSAKLAMVIRDMLLHENGNTLRLFPVLSPAWLKAGESVSVKNMPTTWGRVSAELAVKEGGATLTFKPAWTDGERPGHVAFRLPWFATGGNDTVHLDPAGGTVELRWQLSEVPGLSYEERVRAFAEEYARHIPEEVKRRGDYLKLSPAVHHTREERLRLRKERGLAASCPVTVSSSRADVTCGKIMPSLVVDNGYREIVDTGWVAERVPAPGKPEWLEVDLREPQAVGRIVIGLGEGGRQAVEVQVSEDGAKYASVFGGTSAKACPAEVTCDAGGAKGRYVRVVFHHDEGIKRHPEVRVVQVWPRG